MPGPIRRKLTRDESLRVSKLFFELLLINDNQLEWPPPQARSVDIMKKFLKKIITYLSSANLQTPLGAWLNDVTAEGGNKVFDESD